MSSKIQNTILRVMLLVVLFSVNSFELTAQRGNSSINNQQGDDQEYAPSSLRDRIYVGAYVNSPSILGSNIGTQFNVGLQPFAGYEFNEYISSGLALKFDYLYLNNLGQVTQLTDFSSTIFTRAMFARSFIIQLEGGLYSDHRQLGAFNTERVFFPILFAGVGYSFGNSELILAFDISGNLVRNSNIPFEYKFGFRFDL